MSDLCFLSAVIRRALGYLISNAVDFLDEKIESLPCFVRVFDYELVGQLALLFDISFCSRIVL